MLLGLALACSLLGAAHAQNIDLGDGTPVACSGITGSISLSSVLVGGNGNIVTDNNAKAHPYAICFSAMTVSISAACVVTVDTTNDIPTDIMYPTAWSTNSLYPDSDLLACPRTATTGVASATLFGGIADALEDALWYRTPATTGTPPKPAYDGSRGAATKTFIFGKVATAGLNPLFTCTSSTIGDTSCGVLGLYRDDGLRIAYAVTESTGTYPTKTMAKVQCAGAGTPGDGTQIGSSSFSALCRDSGASVGFYCSPGTYKLLLNTYTDVAPTCTAGTPGVAACSNGATPTCTTGVYSCSNAGVQACTLGGIAICPIASVAPACDGVGTFNCPNAANGGIVRCSSGIVVTPNTCTAALTPATGAVTCTDSSSTPTCSNIKHRYVCVNNYAGSFTAAGANSPTSCPAGKELPAVAGTACTDCSPGYVAKDNHGSSHCQACSTQYFQNLAGQTDCKVCPPGTWAHIPGSAACVKCNQGNVYTCTASTDTDCGASPASSGGGYSIFTISTTTWRTGCTAITTADFPLLTTTTLPHTLDLLTPGAVNTCSGYLATDLYAVAVNERCHVEVTKLNDENCSNPMKINALNFTLNGFAAVLSKRVDVTNKVLTAPVTGLNRLPVTLMSAMPDGEAAPYTDYGWRLDTQSGTTLSMAIFHVTKDPDVVYPLASVTVPNYKMKACADTAASAGGRVANIPDGVGIGGPNCPAGTLDLDNSASVNLCRPCIPGFYCPTPNTVPTLANPNGQTCDGKAQPMYGATVCPTAYCPSGTGPTGTSGVVSSGTVGIFPGDSCVACDIGFYSCTSPTTCVVTIGSVANPTNGKCQTCWSANTVGTETCVLGANKCNDGTVLNSGTGACEPCPAGFYKHTDEMTCLACPAGTYNPYETVRPNPAAGTGGIPVGATIALNSLSDTCICAGTGPATTGLAPTGTLILAYAGSCPSSTASLTAEAARVVALEPGAVESQTCQNGAIAKRSTASTAAFGFDTCEACGIGKIQVGNTCVDCAAGTYRPGGVATINNNRCLRIPPGYKANLNTGGSFLSLCGVGTVSYWSGSPTVVRTPSTGDTCQDCGVAPEAKNTFSAKTGGARCVLCRAGSEAVSLDTTTPGKDTCRNCGLRYYRAALETEGTCALCPAGSETRAPFGASECTACPAGYWYADIPAGQTLYGVTNSGATTLLSAKCYPCPVNYVQPLTGQTLCTACPPGTYTPDTGNSECTPCSPGTYNPVAGGNCIEASKGFYVGAVAGTAGAGAGAISQIKCPVGRFSDDEGNDVCTICPSGTYSNNQGSTSCKLCAAGTYSKRGSSTCLDCLPGYYSPAGAGACLSCKPGYYNNLERAGFCVECPIGSYCPTANLENPIPCRAGMYSTQDTQTSCKKCPPDTYQSAIGSTACISCDLAGSALAGSPNTKGFTTRGTWGVANASGCVAPRTVKKLKRAM